MTVKKEIACIKRAKEKAERTAMMVGLGGVAAFLAGLYFHAVQGEPQEYSSGPGFIVGLIALAYWYGADSCTQSLPPDSEIILELLTEQEEKPKA